MVDYTRRNVPKGRLKWGSRYKNRRTITKMGRKFRTRAGKLGCYVYKNGKRVAFKTLKRNLRYGAAYGAYKARRFYRKHR